MGSLGKNTAKYGSLEISDKSLPSVVMTEYTENSERIQAVKSCITRVFIFTILLCMVFFRLPSSSKILPGNIQKGVGMMGQSKTATTKGPLHFEQQLDHFDESNHQTWLQTYFISDEFFEGPGNPILIIIGGEGPVDDVLYPFVTNGLGKDLSAFVIQTEHRFYGTSNPVGDNPTNSDFKAYLSPEQALADNVQIIRYIQSEHGCSTDKSSDKYCPVITIGGSYPGFLSAMMRLVHPDVVDIGYASSAPLKLYEHASNFDTNGYFDKVARVADMAVPGCVEATYATSKELYDWVLNEEASGTVTEIADQLGICVDTLPSYLHTLSRADLGTELTMLLVTSFADLNSDYYPPSEDTGLVHACNIMIGDSTTETSIQRFKQFLAWKKIYDEEDFSEAHCFDLTFEIPKGPNATISTADWSGAGGGDTGEAWEFQICRDLVVKTGFAGSEKMFYPPRTWTLEWLSQHCQSRFGVLPEPGRLTDMWHFDDLVSHTSRILFTNGLVDGWSASSYLYNLSDTIVALNYPNGAHHSDLNPEWPSPDDTPDILEGFNQITQILREWLELI